MQLLLVVTLISGCATTKNRIRDNQELFDSFPPDVQEKVQSGRIDIGFSKDAVYMAMGKPDQVYERKTSSGKQEVWAYLGYATRSQPYSSYNDHPHYYDRRHHRSRYAYRHHGYPPYRDHTYYYERMRVAFEQGHVVAIDTRKKDPRPSKLR